MSRTARVGEIVLVHHTELIAEEVGGKKVERAEPGPGLPGIITGVDDDGLVSVFVFGAPTYAGLDIHESIDAAHADAETPRHAPGIAVVYADGATAEAEADKPAKKSSTKTAEAGSAPAS